VADPHRAGWGGLLEAGGDVDVDAADRAGLGHAAAEQHFAGVHADADGEGVAVVVVNGAVCALELGADRAAEAAQRQAAAHGALGVVLGGLVGTERREQAVAGVLQHLAAMLADDGGGARQRPVHQRAGVLGVEPLRHARRADDVHEEDAHLLERLRRGGRRGGGSAQCGEPRPHRPQGAGDDRVAEHRTLGFERGDRCFELVYLRRHEAEA
jgi:hypothetical protein